MAESDLSNEVNATTVLPAASNLTTIVNNNDNVDLSWTNNDDSIDGGIDVERSSDGGSTWNDLVTGLSPSTTSYEDTSASVGNTYKYRIERNTDHATATSVTATITVTLGFTIGGNVVTEATIDGDPVTGLTIDGDVVF